MSLFGSSPPDESSTTTASAFGHSASSIFEDEPAMTKSTSSALFADDDPSGTSSPWDMPTPRKAKSRADLLKTLLPASDVPESYIETFDAVASGGRVSAGGVARTLAAAHISADEQARIMTIVAPAGGSGGGEVSLGRNEFNALLALIGLAQDGEVPSLDGVDERRRSQYPFHFSCLVHALCCFIILSASTHLKLAAISVLFRVEQELSLEVGQIVSGST